MPIPRAELCKYFVRFLDVGRTWFIDLLTFRTLWFNIFVNSYLLLSCPVNDRRCIFTFSQSGRPNTYLKKLGLWPNTKAKTECWIFIRFLSICRFNLTFANANPFLIKPCKIFNGQHNHFFNPQRHHPLLEGGLKFLDERSGVLMD